MNNYSFLQRLLHKIIFGNKYLLNLVYEIEQNLLKDKSREVKKLFITGYARSGTTILLNKLYDTGFFKSLTYEDMPFTLSPKINNFFKKFRYYNLKFTRAHKDNIKINLSSPEAFEEIFWKLKLNNEYIKKNYLSENSISTKILNQFEDYVRIICENNKIYLSKNNNNILRINQLIETKDSLILILFRDPENQSISLKKQHLNFLRLQKEDKFILNYMNSLGHYEFGKNHKPFFSYKEKINYEYSDINYWIFQWVKVYTNLLNKYEKLRKKENIFFVSYEKLCQNPELFNEKISKFFQININIENLKNNNTLNHEETSKIDKNLLKQSKEIYLRLNEYNFF